MSHMMASEYTVTLDIRVEIEEACEAERKAVKVLEFLLLINTCHVFVH
jgi:hypothetical protein